MLKKALIVSSLFCLAGCSSTASKPAEPRKTAQNDVGGKATKLSTHRTDHYASRDKKPASRSIAVRYANPPLTSLEKSIAKRGIV